MHQIIKRLPWKLRIFLIRIFLKKNNIEFADVPYFSGPWPDFNNKGKISIGEDCCFRSRRLKQCFSVREKAELIIGHSSFFNDGVNLCATCSIKIGHHARIGDMTYIYDSDFHEISPAIPVKRAPVIIGNNVWIGANSMILPGTVIGDHSVIAGGSIVTGEVPAKSLVGGAPARVIKTLDMPDGWVRK